jgi:hypothetical protein
MRRRQNVLDRDFSHRWRRPPAAAGGAPRPNVLLEEPNVREAFASWSLLEDNGYDVTWCPGPTGPPPRRCPLVECGPCPLVHHADVVVSSLGLHRASSRQVVAAITTAYPRTPVVVQAPPQLLDIYRPLLRGVHPLTMPVNDRSLLESVRRALHAAEDGVDGTFETGADADADADTTSRRASTRWRVRDAPRAVSTSSGKEP